MPAFIGIGYDLQNAVGTAVEESFILVQPDAYGEAESGVQGAEQQHGFGFMARPIDPGVDENGEVLPGEACATLYGKDGNDLHCWNGMDPRYIPNLPELKKGEGVTYGSKRWQSPTFHHIDEDGSHIWYVPVEFDSDNVPTKAHQLAIGVDGNGAPSITLQHSEGMAVMLFDGKTVLRNTDGSVYLELSGTEAVFNGNTKLNGACLAGSLDLPMEPLVKYTTLVQAFVEFVANINASIAGQGVPPVVPPVSLANAFTAFLQGN